MNQSKVTFEDGRLVPALAEFAPYKRANVTIDRLSAELEGLKARFKYECEQPQEVSTARARMDAAVSAVLVGGQVRRPPTENETDDDSGLARERMSIVERAIDTASRQRIQAQIAYAEAAKEAVVPAMREATQEFLDAIVKAADSNSKLGQLTASIRSQGGSLPFNFCWGDLGFGATGDVLSPYGVAKSGHIRTRFSVMIERAKNLGFDVPPADDTLRFFPSSEPGAAQPVQVGNLYRENSRLSSDLANQRSLGAQLADATAQLLGRLGIQL